MPRPTKPVIEAAAKTPSEFKIEAAAVAWDIEAKAADGSPKRPTFSIVGYTGAVMQVAGFYSPVIVDLAGLKASRDKIPIFLDHDPSRIVGQTSSVTIDASGVRLEGSITGDDADANKVMAHAKNGFEWQASIGATVVRQEFLKAGEKAVVNGREVAGPLMIARESRLQETSFVAIGADGQTTAAVAASLFPGSPKGTPTMFDKWLLAKGFSDPAALDDTQRASLQAMYDAEQAAVKKTPAALTPSLDEIVARRQNEVDRVESITKLADDAMEDRPNLIAEFKLMAKAAIANNSTIQDFELALLRASRSRASGNGFIKSADPVASAKMIEAAVCMSGNLTDLEKKYDEKTLNAASDLFPHGLGLRDLLLLAARENGFTPRTSGDLKGLLRAAFGAGQNNGMIRADGFSTMSIPGILSNVANKFLAQGFNAIEDGWREITSIRNVRDFKTNTSYSLTGGFIYEKVGPGGELKHATANELPYTIRADTYGKMFAITRTDLINDDLGALTQVPMKLGRGAALKLNDVFWTEFLADITTFYHTNHSNVISSGTSALSSGGLTLALAKFRKQTDPDSLPLGVTPKILLVPPELEITADELVTSMFINTGGSSTTDKVPNRNVWAGKFKTVMSSYLSNSAYTGYSTTHWFLLADPQDLPVIEVAFLNGQQTPTVESADADFDSLGIQMRGYHDFGVAKQEYRAGVRALGT